MLFLSLCLFALFRWHYVVYACELSLHMISRSDCPVSELDCCEHEVAL